MSKLEPSAFEKELRDLINCHSRENKSNTPDFILASYLRRCLEAGEYLVERRDMWYGRERDISEVNDERD